MTKKITECKNCNNLFEGNYCNLCGQKASIKRFSLSNFTSEFFLGFFQFHGGMIYTIKELFLRPGKMLRGYIAGKRVNHINPFSYLVLISVVGEFLYHYTGIKEHSKTNLLASLETIQFTGEYYVYRMLLATPIFAFLCWILFRSIKYNFAEHLIINTYIMSQGLVILNAFMLALCFIKLDDMCFEIYMICSLFFVLICQTIVLTNLFNQENKVLRWIKAITVVFGGFSLSFIVINMLTRLFALLKLL